MKRLTRNLIDNSIEAFILSLETINRPSVKYRIETFCFLFCNAWELLMKAKLLDSGHKIFHKKKRKQPRISLRLDECLDQTFLFEKDPTKLNIKTVSELRNSAMHLVIPFIPPDIMGLFQAGVINYPKALQDWFGINLSERVPLGMMALIYDFDPKMQSPQYLKIRRKLSAETVRWLTAFQQSIRKEAETFGAQATQFYIPIDLKLAIVKNPTKADIVLSSGSTGQGAILVEVPKDIDKLYPFRGKEVVEQVNQRLGEKAINIHDIVCIRHVYSIQSRAEFYYKSVHSPPLYSEKFVEWIDNQATKNATFFVDTRSKAKVKGMHSKI